MFKRVVNREFRNFGNKRISEGFLSCAEVSKAELAQEGIELSVSGRWPLYSLGPAHFVSSKDIFITIVKARLLKMVAKKLSWTRPSVLFRLIR